MKTRWNSEFTSAKSYIELREHVEAATRREGYSGPAPLSHEDLNILQDYILLFKPIDDMTNILSGENYVTGRAPSTCKLILNLILKYITTLRSGKFSSILCQK